MHCAKSGKNVSETLQVLTEAYSADAMKNSSVCEWHKRFKVDWKHMKDAERIGHSEIQQTDEHVERVQKLVYSDK